jgi:phage replication-related protein YjqB (UPF0714/DUF867 family)
VDKYASFAALARNEKQGEDYDLETRKAQGARFVVIAPHGGTIEPRTDRIADAIAGGDFSFYCFRALKPNSRLHIKSHLFDEPTCLELVMGHESVLSIHGWGEDGERICAGGLDVSLTKDLTNALAVKRIHLEEARSALRGADAHNITNRGISRRGVQLELTMAFRRNGETVKRFVEVVREVLLNRQGRQGARNEGT